jgi:hypothetical protein
MTQRAELFARGVERTTLWCERNGIEPPGLRVVPREEWRFAPTCAYYRPTTTNICLKVCAMPGYGGRAWSWPGYVIDRTPYGVPAHELGHHVDWLRSERRGSYFGDFSQKLRRASGEEKLTNYCPNDAEWFAEMFRLFVTNADLLEKVRPRTYMEIRSLGFEPVSATWEIELAGAPERTIAQARKKFVAPVLI